MSTRRRTTASGRRSRAVSPKNSGDCVKVYIRVRPVNESEKRKNQKYTCPLVFVDDGKSLQVPSTSGSRTSSDVWTFDHTFRPEAKQHHVFDTMAKSIMDFVVEGFNGTIFAYGQTGSGKTWSMFGEAHGDNWGVIPRSVNYIFDCLSAKSDVQEVTIKVGVLEIYRERIRDLLQPNSSNLKVREKMNGDVYADGLVEEYVSSLDDVLELLQISDGNRSVAATDMNEVSSRGHTVLQMTIEQRMVDGSVCSSKLNLADLAGSERVEKTNAAGVQLKEAQKINQSLSALGNVINSLTSSSTTHVPFRDSRLTFLLKDSLGGNTKTSLLVTCSPHKRDIDETMSSLAFAKRVKYIKNAPKVNKVQSVAVLNRQIHELKKLLREREAEIVRLTTSATISELPSTTSEGPNTETSDTAATSPVTSEDPATVVYLREELEFVQTELAVIRSTNEDLEEEMKDKHRVQMQLMRCIDLNEEIAEFVPQDVTMGLQLSTYHRGVPGESPSDSHELHKEDSVSSVFSSASSAVVMPSVESRPCVVDGCERACLGTREACFEHVEVKTIVPDFLEELVKNRLDEAARKRSRGLSVAMQSQMRLQKQLETQQEEVERLQRANRALQATLQNQQVSKSKHEETVESLQSKIDELSNEKEKLSFVRRIEDLQSRLEEMSEENRELRLRQENVPVVNPDSATISRVQSVPETHSPSLSDEPPKHVTKFVKPLRRNQLNQRRPTKARTPSGMHNMLGKVATTFQKNKVMGMRSSLIQSGNHRVLCEGYVYKQSRWRGKWKRRYVVLQVWAEEDSKPKKLWIDNFKDHPQHLRGDLPRGAIVLSPDDIVKPEMFVSYGLEKEGFEIISKSLTVRFYVDDEGNDVTRDTWTTAINDGLRIIETE